MNSKRWACRVIGAYVLLLCLTAVAVFIVDPYFHYHAPLEGMSYVMDEAEYVNDGITKNFDYDMVITGSSTTRGFSTEAADELFRSKSVRLTFLGEGFRRVNDNLQTAVRTHPDLKLVIRGVDTLFFVTEEDWLGYDSYPEYLYDDCLGNDVYYVFNGDVLLGKVFPEVIRSFRREPAQGFDAYIDKYGEAGSRESVMADYKRPEKEERIVDEAETKQMLLTLENNLQKNVIAIMEENPDITFYLFLPPYSILWWDQYHQYGSEVLERRILMEKYAIEKLLTCENVRLFSFTSNGEWICNFENYCDSVHYTKDANTQILKWMRDGEYELTQDNYMQYIDSITEFLCNYDYDALFEGA